MNEVLKIKAYSVMMFSYFATFFITLMTNFNELMAFATVVREGSFTRAAAQMGISQSALSHTIRHLEKKLAIKLLHRTTRSVSPTEAGQHLYQTVAPRFEDIETEIATLSELQGKPTGTVRITATEHSFNTILWPRLRDTLHQYPDIRIEITSDYRFTDIVAERYDIGIRLGDSLAKDMIAVRIAPDLQMVVVATPTYLAQHQQPTTPQEIIQHQCITLRLPTYGGLMPWEFMHHGKTTTLHVPARIVFNSNSMVIQATLAHYGLAWLPLDSVLPYIEQGQLVTLLDDWRATFPGYHLYYATRHASQALMVIVDALRWHSPA